jgi:nucleotide sugar dehydrogenase
MYNIGIIGLGYVGLPLALEFGKKFRVIGFDNKISKINKLKKKIDVNGEINPIQFKKAKYLQFTSRISILKNCNFYIITVPTPINNQNKPDIKILKSVTYLVSKIIKPGSFVIYESTVYPGTTDEICKNIIEKNSGLKLNKDFYLGYSPERININDKHHQLTNTTKIVSGSNKFATKEIFKVYKKIIKNLFIAKSIKVAEAAKVIENTQRDINIALMNELSIIFRKLHINTRHVLEAAKTKWNFNDYVPGLVGGHCIGVDPYYLAYKSQKIGYIPKIILAGRKINDEMANFVSKDILKCFKEKKIDSKKSNLIILGFTFKENCSDIRNSKIYNLYLNLKNKFKKIYIVDPNVNSIDAKKFYNIRIINKFPNCNYQGLIFAVGHSEFKNRIFLKKILKNSKDKILYDIKNSVHEKYLTRNL